MTTLGYSEENPKKKEWAELIDIGIIVTLDKTINEAYLVDVAILSSHNLHSAITKRLQKYTDLKEELIRIWQLKTAHIIPSVLPTTCIIPNKSHKKLKLPDLHPAVYILMRRALIEYIIHAVELDNVWLNSG